MVIGLRYYFALILFLAFGGLIAQDSTQNKSVYIGVSVSSGWSKTFFSASQQLNLVGMTRDVIPMRIGLDFKIKFTERLSLATGFYIDKTGTKIESKYVLPEYYIASQRASRTTQNTNTYFEIPLRVDIRFNSKRISPFITAGGYGGLIYKAITSTDFILRDGSKGYTYGSHYFNPNLNITKQLYSNFQLGFGLDANVQNFKIQAYPLYDFGFLLGYPKPIYRHRIGLALTVACGF